MKLSRLIPALLVWGLCSLPRPVEATAKGEWVVGLAPSYAFIVLGSDSEPEGGGSMIFVHHGLSEALALRVSGLWSGHNIDAEGEEAGGLYQVVNAAAGIQYSFDLLSVTPALEIAAGLLYLRYQGQSAYNFGLQVGVSVDYWVVDWLGVGAAFHYHAFISNPSDYPVYFDAGPRVAVRWR